MGGGVPEMLERAAGVSLLDLTLRVALGEPVFVDGPVATDRIGYRFFLQPPTVSATVTAIDGINDFSDHAEVDTVSLHQGPGATLDWRTARATTSWPWSARPTTKSSCRRPTGSSTKRSP